MNSFVLLFAAWTGLLVFLYRRRIYPALIVAILVAAYELPAIGLFYLRIEVPLIQSAQGLFDEFASPDLVSDHVLTLASFLAAFAVGSLVASQSRARAVANAAGSTVARDSIRTHSIFGMCLALTMLVFGVASAVQQEGLRRLEDYLGGDYVGLPLFSYGIALLPVSVCLALVLYLRGRANIALLIMLASLPLLHEIFLSGRRQFVLPALFVILLYWLYRPQGFRWLSLIGLAGLTLVFFGFQFSLRETVVGDKPVISESVVEGTFAPPLGELIAIGATSLSSYPVVEQRGTTDGKQLVVTVLNAVPFARLGSRLLPDVSDDFADIARTVAPVGGLSVLAESYLSFGRAGVMFIGLLVALLACMFHRRLVEIFSWHRYSAVNMLWVSIGCVLLGKYRSGVSDAFLSFTTMSILFGSLYLISLIGEATLLLSVHQVGRNEMDSTITPDGSN